MSNKTPHPQAEILRAIADGKIVEICHKTKDIWFESTSVLAYVGDEGYRLRIKPEIMALAGHEFPFPVREPLENGQKYWTPDVHGFVEICRTDIWIGHKVDFHNLKRGLIQLTKEGAIAQAKAMIAAVGGDV